MTAPQAQEDLRAIAWVEMMPRLKNTECLPTSVRSVAGPGLRTAFPDRNDMIEDINKFDAAAITAILAGIAVRGRSAAWRCWCPGPRR